MKLNAFGKIIELVRENEEWITYDLGDGKKSRSFDFYIPAHYSTAQAIQFLEDLLHEKATPQNSRIKIVE